jgi:PAS domain S-box-containing protein
MCDTETATISAKNNSFPDDELILSRQRLALHVQQTPLAVIEWDIRGHVVEWNPAAVRMFGYSREEALGQHWTFLVPETHRKNVENVVSEIYTKKIANHFTSENLDRESRIILCEWFNSPLIALNGHTIGAASLVMDITERKKTEEQVRELLREKDLLLKEVHHRIKNNMSTVISLLSMQAGMQQDPASAAALQDACGRLRSMSILYDKLYRSENLKELSLGGYLRPLIGEILQVFPFKGHIQSNLEIEDFSLPVKQLSSLGMIVNELITNILKHAFPGQSGGSIVVIVRKTGVHVSLIVEDDGIGIPEVVDIENPEGFGLQLVNLLTQQLNGTLTVERKAGTRFVVEFDKQSELGK